MPSISNFVTNAREIVVFAGVGTIISTLLVGFGLFYVKEVGKYFKRKRERASRIIESTVVWHVYSSSLLSNLFHCHCHVLRYSKTPKQVIF